MNKCITLPMYTNNEMMFRTFSNGFFFNFNAGRFRISILIASGVYG